MCKKYFIYGIMILRGKLMGKDFRSERTKEKIIKAFIELLGTKGYEKIAINEIALKANINRVTFYTHYKDKEVLLNDIIDRVQDSLNKKALEKQNNYSLPTDFQNYIVSQINVLVEEIDSYRHIIYKLEAQDNAIIYYTLVNKTTENITHELENINKITPLKYSPKYIASFVIPGLFNVIMSYLNEKDYDKKNFEESLNRLVNDLVTSNIIF